MHLVEYVCLLLKGATVIELIKTLSSTFESSLKRGKIINEIVGLYKYIMKFHYHLSEPKKVFCDMATDGGDWTVIQRRQDGSVNFKRTWAEYKNGFGSLEGEHWLGNKYIHDLTFNGRAFDLRIDLADWEDQERHATYSFFTVDYERNTFRLEFDQFIPEESTVEDSLSYHNGQYFATMDRDNSSSNCASVLGGFWHNSCQRVGLNNHYSHSSSEYGTHVNDQIRWDSWHGNRYSLKATKMMIRPID